jgi:ribosomal protein L11 methyltransferase
LRSWPALEARFTTRSPGELTDLEDRLSAALDNHGPSAIQQFDDRWLVFFNSPGARDLAATSLPAAVGDRIAVQVVDVADEEWAERSQRNLTAVDIGRVTIAPPWAVPAGAVRAGDAGDAGRLTIVISPSMGFGTGHHATTRLCTELLQRLDLAGRTVLDVGTGSGVLALTARALGALTVVAVDDDPDAIESAQGNLALNRVEDGIDLRVGDFRGLPLLCFDVVVANLTGGLLSRSADVLARIAAPRGTLLISGVTLEEEAEVLRAFAPWMTVVERLAEDEWMAARLCHDGPRLQALGESGSRAEPWAPRRPSRSEHAASCAGNR